MMQRKKYEKDSSEASDFSNGKSFISWDGNMGHGRRDFGDRIKNSLVENLFFNVY